MTTQSPARWWHGRRGEWFVVGQTGLLLLLVFGPRTAPGVPAWPASIGGLSMGIGILLIAAGGAWMLLGARALGRNLTPLPSPRADGHVVSTGAYAFVRHPIYCGVIRAAIGWALYMQSLITLGYALLVFVFLDVKARWEERWLRERFPEYGAYQARVRKLIPFVY